MAELDQYFCQHFLSVVEKAATEIGFNNINIIFKDGVGKGVGFLGEIHRLIVKGDLKNDESELHLIAKILPPDNKKRINTPVEFYCAVETFIYDKVFPKFDKLQYEEKIKRTFFRPNTYAICVEKFKEIIVMDDLSKQDYEMARIGKTLDFEHSVLLLEEAARFHGLSMVYRARHPADFENLINEMPTSEALKSMTENLLRGSLKYASDNVHYPVFQDILQHFKKANFLEKFDYQVNGNNYKNSVILHGDLWANNSLFNYKENKPEKIVLLDWQCSKYASPVIDLYFALFIAVDEETRRQRFQDLVNIYYNALCEFIQSFGENATELYPEQEFRDDLKKFSFAGMSIALFMLPIFTSDHEEVEKNLDGSMIVGDGIVIGSSVPTSMYIDRIKQMADDISTHALDESW